MPTTWEISHYNGYSADITKKYIEPASRELQVIK